MTQPANSTYGVYNYKAIVAYDGTTYKYDSSRLAIAPAPLHSHNLHSELHPYQTPNPCRGFQLQHGKNNNVPTVQGVLERVLCQIKQETRETLRMQCSGRTDAGVHSRGQVHNLTTLVCTVTLDFPCVNAVSGSDKHKQYVSSHPSNQHRQAMYLHSCCLYSI